MMYSFVLKKYTRNKVVYSQGDKANYIYIVKEGEFEITRQRKKKAINFKKGMNSLSIYQGFVI